jgi:pyruvate dehydrogenase E1 component beta subunit
MYPDTEVPRGVRTPSGGGRGDGPTHRHCPENVLAAVPGLTVVAPSHRHPVGAMLKAAVLCWPNPTVFLEHKLLYETKGEVPEEAYTIPFGQAVTRREGTDVTIVTWSKMLFTVLEAAEQAAAKGISVEVIDPRTLVPLDREAILNSVRKTGRLIVAHEAAKTGGAGAEIAALVAEEAIYDLKAPIRRVGAKDVPIPQSAYLEQFCIPQVEDVVAAIDEVMAA